MKGIRVIAIAGFLMFVTPGLSQAMPWSWDMFSQPSHKAQEDKAPERPSGVVPVAGQSVPVKDRADAGRLRNPIAPTEASIERGRLKYRTYCGPCHGDGGKGDGLVGQKYVTPTDLTAEYVQGKPPGDIYYTITSGGLAIMPSYGDSVPVEDRWHIVNYIKNALGEKKGK